MSEKLLMRNEILRDGSPLPLKALLAAKHAKSTITDDEIKSIWSQAMQQVRRLICSHFQGVEPVMIELWRLDQKKTELIKSLLAYPVTLDSYDTIGAYRLGVSRHFAPGGREQLGIGERPGYSPLATQLSTLRRTIGKRPIVLLEDDIFTGGTAAFVLQRMKAAGLHIVAFVPGLQASTSDHLAGVPILPVERHSHVRDMVDPRDLLFGLPDAGLVIREGTTLYRAPWCLPYVDVSARASVDTDAAQAFSLDVISMNMVFFRQLEAQLRQTIYVRDLAYPFQAFARKILPEKATHMTIGDFCAYTRGTLQKRK